MFKDKRGDYCFEQGVRQKSKWQPFKIRNMQKRKILQGSNIPIFMEKKTPLEIWWAYTPKNCCGKLSRMIMIPILSVNHACWNLIHSNLFEGIILVTIVVNTGFLALEDPTRTITPDYIKMADFAFLIIYTIECVCKILGLGLIFHDKSYLRSPWNILDFIIVASSYLTLTQGEGSSVNLTGFRAIRVIRPLKTITKISRLRQIIATIVNSIPFLLDILLVLGFFFTVMAIAGQQMFAGLLKHRCANADGQINFVTNQVCDGSSASCEPGEIC